MTSKGPVKIGVPAARRVLADPPYPMDSVRNLLADTGVTVETRGRPWSGNDVAGILVVSEPITAADLEGMPSLEVIATCSVGFDHIDIEAAEARGIWVCNVPDYCIEEMADSTLALVLSLLRGVVFLDRSVRAGRWDDHAAGPLQRVRGTTLGVIGFGRIGRAVARQAIALGFDVWATDPLLPPAALSAAGAHPASLEQLLASCQVVTLHLPLTRETRRLIGARELAMMKPGSYLVNAARGELLDWPAFLDALERRQLAGAAVDVLPIEPPTSERPSPQLDNLIVTPHSAWYSAQSEAEAYRRAILAVRAVLSGKLPESAVTRPKNIP